MVHKNNKPNGKSLEFRRIQFNFSVKLMKVKCLFFAEARELIQETEVEFDIKEGISCSNIFFTNLFSHVCSNNDLTNLLA